MEALERHIRNVLKYGGGLEEPGILEMFVDAGWPEAKVKGSLNKLLRERRAIKLTLIFDSSDPQSRNAPPRPPIPPPTAEEAV